jgi:ketosteroid isomerase-like protein
VGPSRILPTNRDAGADEIAVAWLLEMQASVQTVDYERCRKIFAPDVVAFGTRARAVLDIESLERDQWRRIWNTIEAFHFELDNLTCGAAGDSLVWLACPWTSKAANDRGTCQARTGRMTAILERRSEKWLAIHTHFSLTPQNP